MNLPLIGVVGVRVRSSEVPGGALLLSFYNYLLAYNIQLFVVYSILS